MFDPEGPPPPMALSCSASVQCPHPCPLCVPRKLLRLRQTHAAALALLGSPRLTSHSKFPGNRVGVTFLLSLHGNGSTLGLY